MNRLTGENKRRSIEFLSIRGLYGRKLKIWRKAIKYLVIICALQFTSTVARGQIVMGLLFGDKLNSDELSFGIHVDYGLSRLSNISDQKSLSSVNLGLFFTYHFNQKWHANLEMLAKLRKGANKLQPYDLGNDSLNTQFIDGDVQRRIGYLALPMTMQYQTGNFFFELGPLIGLRIKAEDVFSADQPQGELKLTRNIKDETNVWDLGWIAGGGFSIGKSKSLSLGLRYTGGFTDVMQNIDGRQENQQWSIYTNIPIGRAKAAAKKAKANGQ
ncbi:outer membrane beta-barrel protein [Pedobacter sp. HMF7647]|uniref:Outer membrane beta-barrel protein n=1 Tax=Hufsiella arboris TaxID=2695275 RepID=A0A7K1Y982_9SPHI|nr:porin family protein [Hufsiella arboris]MXV51135.1 outer membrane beta-barrel protein [Hufsiella arboris]